MKSTTMTIIRFLFLIVLAALGMIGIVNADKQEILNVMLELSAFNSNRDAKVQLSYTLTQPDKVRISIYDADNGLVRTLAEAVSQNAGKNRITWDGRDEEGQPVPDEAYTFIIETASGAVYDPTTFSGGVVGDITEAQFDPGGTVGYKLPAPARVLIRLGIKNGPMLKTLVDWNPRVAGAITEFWDGRDENKLIRLREHKGFSSLITYVTLPEATVIAYGNKKETYRDYKLGRGKGRPQKPVRPRLPDPKVRLRPENLVPPAWARAPNVQMTFPKHTAEKKDTVPKVRDAISVRIDVDPTDREQLLSDQFEVILFVDNVFFAEAERGHLPLNWHWELQQFPPGDHILTANISSFKGQVGVVNRKVSVMEPKP